MTFILEETDNIIIVKGKCEYCGEEVEIRVNREPQQKYGWGVYRCEKCGFWGQGNQKG